MVSPWSIPLLISYGFVSLWAVITWFVMLVSMLLIILIILCGILILWSACISICLFTESKALLMSWLKIQISLLFSLASSAILLRICIGYWVLLPSSPAQLLEEKISWWRHILLILSEMMFMKIFLVVSKRAMGLVILMSPSQSFGLGMGYMLPFFQSFGIVSELRIVSKRCLRKVIPFFPRFLRAWYSMKEFPGALLFFFLWIAFLISSNWIGSVHSWYQDDFIWFLGLYWFFHSE